MSLLLSQLTPAVVDEPPRRSMAGLFGLLLAWQPVDNVPPRPVAIAPLVPAVAIVDQPKPIGMPAAVLAQWAVDWGSQRRYYLTPPSVDNPPRFKAPNLVDRWPSEWGAQAPIKRTPDSVDNPPKFRAPNVADRWAVDWGTQRSPFIVPPDVIVVVDQPTPTIPWWIADAWKITWDAPRRLFVPQSGIVTAATIPDGGVSRRKWSEEFPEHEKKVFVPLDERTIRELWPQVPNQARVTGGVSLSPSEFAALNAKAKQVVMAAWMLFTMMEDDD